MGWREVRRSISILAALAAIATGSCADRRQPERAPYLPLTEIEATYGPLMTAGNHPTPDQNGSGERVGLFRDASGTVWGLPLAAGSNGAVLACAPPQVR